MLLQVEWSFDGLIHQALVQFVEVSFRFSDYICSSSFVQTLLFLTCPPVGLITQVVSFPSLSSFV